MWLARSQTHTPMFVERAARDYDAWTRANSFEIHADVMRWAPRVSAWKRFANCSTQ